jgi:oxygen-independent coproporphyrinogen-3 oxidase
MNGLYFHIPFCPKKCPYCDFFSTDRHSAADLEDYISLLCRHLELVVEAASWHGPLQSVYFGGGTPTLLSSAQIGRLLGAVDQQIGLTADAEISLEGNPGTLSLSRLEGYRTAGVNRLSLGIQTQNPRQLRQLGRQHSRSDSLQAVRWARQAGFRNLSLDLIFALPGQTLPDLQQEVREYAGLAPEHLSCYGLTAEAGTPLEAVVRQGAVVLPDGDFYADAFMCLHEGLQTAGYEHYEIANYARPGFACRHNLGYWQRQPCLGLGAGAHSFRPAGWGERWAVPAALEVFRSAVRQGHDPSVLLEKFDRRAAMAETLYLGLRTRQGVDEATFRKTFGAGVSEAFPGPVAQLAASLQHQAGAWRFQPASWLLFDRLIQAFL